MITVVQTREELRAARDRLAGQVGVVLTMGALHEGHRRLLATAREASDCVVASIFVNPLQFGANEDLDRYPRTFEADLATCESEGVSLVFAPSQDVMYPGGQPVVRVGAGSLGDLLEGASRPGHFDGVLTVVAKLFHLLRPDAAFFGEKDAQQLALIRRMVSDLDFGVKIVAVPTVREPDGLALSSRNTYLSVGERFAALALSRALQAGAARHGDGADAVLQAAGAVLGAESGIDLDYLALVDDDTWQAVDRRTVRARLLIAARVGTTRLIDNVPVHLGTTQAVNATAG